MDTLTKEQRSKLMSHVGNKDTLPERYIRSLLHRLRYRFGLHSRTIVGTPDLVLRKYGVLIFVDGCFWHGHEDCPLFRPPKTGKKYWNVKIERNRQRDKEIDRRLLVAGWRVLHIWECALHSKARISEEKLIGAIENFLHGKGRSKSIRGRRERHA
jgi:DNA mismatch endonuclease (patch repair protein)